MIVPLSAVPDKTVFDSDYQAYIHRDDHISPTSETFMFVCFLKGVIMFLCLRELFVQEKQYKFLIVNILYCFASLSRKTLTSAATTK